MTTAYIHGVFYEVHLRCVKNLTTYTRHKDGYWKQKGWFYTDRGNQLTANKRRNAMNDYDRLYNKFVGKGKVQALRVEEGEETELEI